jgi:DHA1 family multidrug resistance protein-like MFS transporter
MRDVGATILEVGLILAVFSLTGTIVRIPFALLSEQFGKKTIILIALGVQPISILSLYLVPSPIWFYPSIVLRALPFAAYWAAATALASDMAVSGKRGLTMGLYFTSFGGAMFLGPLLCSFLTEFLPYKNILLVIMIFPFLSLLFFLKSGLANQDSTTLPQLTKNEGTVLNALKRILKSKNIKALVMVSILNSLSMGIFDTLFSIYAREVLLFTPSVIALLFTIRGGANASIRIPAGKISDKIGSRKTPLISANLLQFLAYFVISMTGNYHLLLLGMIFFGLGWGIRAVTNATFFIESVESRDKELALSISVTTFGIGSLFGSILVGIISSFIPTIDILKLAVPPLFLCVLIMTFFTSD